MIRVNRGSRSNAFGATQKQLTCLWTTLKNNNQVMAKSHALAQLHAVDDNLQALSKITRTTVTGCPVRSSCIPVWHGRLLTIIVSNNFHVNGQYALACQQHRRTPHNIVKWFYK